MNEFFAEARAAPKFMAAASAGRAVADQQYMPQGANPHMPESPLLDCTHQPARRVTWTGRGNGYLPLEGRGIQCTSDDFGIRHTQLSRGPVNYHPVLSEDTRTDDGRLLVFHIR